VVGASRLLSASCLALHQTKQLTLRDALRMPPVTCHLRYQIDPSEIDAFERFAKRWIALVERSGGQHHGYFLPSEGASDVAYALFTFPSLAAYEQYRQGFGRDPDFIAADRIREESSCVLRYERSFLRPVLDGDPDA
jgi:NIPSNAP